MHDDGRKGNLWTRIRVGWWLAERTPKPIHHPFRCPMVSAGGYGGATLGVSRFPSTTTVTRPQTIDIGSPQASAPYVS